MEKTILEKKLDLVYRGERSYIYGPDLFNSSIKEITNFLNVSKLDHVDFSSHKMAHSSLRLLLFDENVNLEEHLYQSKITVKSNGKDCYGYLLSLDEDVAERLPYPEDEIIENSKLDFEAKEMVLLSKTRFKLTDNYTALNKYLHQQLFKDIKGKWIFVRVVYTNFVLEKDYNSLKVKLVKNFSNKYTQSKLFLDDEIIGTLYFSLI